MTKQQVIKQAKAIINTKKQRAETIADANYQLALQSTAFATNETNIANLTMDIAKKEFANENPSELIALLKTLNKERDKILKSLGLKDTDLVSQYSCKKCNDKGIINGKFCKCMQAEINTLLTKDVGYNINSAHTFDKVDKEYIDKNGLSKIYEIMTTWVEKYPTSKYKNFTFVGAPGRGKTYLTDCIANGLIKKQAVVNYITAFNLNNSMLNYHTTFDDSKSSLLEPFLTCDVLIIDDLGTEPILKNITKEYFFLIINERLISDKSTIVSTNLSPEEIIDRYGERVFSRLFNKNNCLRVAFTNSDLRLDIKKQEK